MYPLPKDYTQVLARGSYFDPDRLVQQRGAEGGVWREGDISRYGLKFIQCLAVFFFVFLLFFVFQFETDHVSSFLKSGIRSLVVFREGGKGGVWIS